MSDDFIVAERVDGNDVVEHFSNESGARYYADMRGKDRTVYRKIAEYRRVVKEYR